MDKDFSYMTLTLKLCFEVTGLWVKYEPYWVKRDHKWSRHGIYMTRNFDQRGEITYPKPVMSDGQMEGCTDRVITIAYRVPADQPGP